MVVLKPDIESFAIISNEYVPGVAIALIEYWDPVIDKKVGAPAAENVMLITEFVGVLVIVGNAKLWAAPVNSIDWVTNTVLGVIRVAQ